MALYVCRSTYRSLGSLKFNKKDGSHKLLIRQQFIMKGRSRKARPKVLFAILVLIFFCSLAFVINVAVMERLYLKKKGKVGTSYFEILVGHFKKSSRTLEELSMKSNLFSSQQQQQKYAYAFLMAGCDSSNPTYMGFLFNIIVSAHILRKCGSTSDIIVLARMATKSNETTLPEDVENMLHVSNIILRYLPKVKEDNFYSAMMDKFVILDLVQYDRVLFLDADVMPLCNLDYMFHLSKNSSLRENVVLAFKSSPANGGFFMLAPNHTDYLKILQIQKNRLKKGYRFDRVNGWGHKIQTPDEWVTVFGKTGTKWTFHGALADQGLLYYWTKYYKKSVSIIGHNNTAGTWSSRYSGSNDTAVQMIDAHSTILGPGCASTLPPEYHQFRDAVTKVYQWVSGIPYNDFVHFTGYSKP